MFTKDTLPDGFFTNPDLKDADGVLDGTVYYRCKDGSVLPTDLYVAEDDFNVYVLTVHGGDTPATQSHFDFYKNKF